MKNGGLIMGVFELSHLAVLDTGLDASDPAFWQRGLGVIRGMIDELEAMG